MGNVLIHGLSQKVVTSFNGYYGSVSPKKGDYTASLVTTSDDSTVQDKLDSLDTGKADKATTLEGYGITDAATSEQMTSVENSISQLNTEGISASLVNTDVGTLASIIKGVSGGLASGGDNSALSVLDSLFIVRPPLTNGDVNEVTMNGIYRTDGTTANTPTSQYGVLLHFQTNTWAAQLWFPMMNTAYFYFKTWWSSNAPSSAWFKVTGTK